MITTVPVAKWATLFDEMPLAIRQLKTHREDSSRAAAQLFHAAYDVLHCGSQQRTWDILVRHIWALGSLMEDHYEVLPDDVRDFVGAIVNASGEFEMANLTTEVAERLSAPIGQDVGHVAL